MTSVTVLYMYMYGTIFFKVLPATSIDLEVLTLTKSRSSRWSKNAWTQVTEKNLQRTLCYKSHSCVCGVVLKCWRSCTCRSIVGRSRLPSRRCFHLLREPALSPRRDRVEEALGSVQAKQRQFLFSRWPDVMCLQEIVDSPCMFDAEGASRLDVNQGVLGVLVAPWCTHWNNNIDAIFCQVIVGFWRLSVV